MKMGEQAEKVVDIITEILAFVTVAFIVFLSINRYVKDGAGFFSVKTTEMLESIREIAVLAIVGLAGLQFALKRGIIIFIFYAILVAAAVVLLFFPNVLPANHILLPLQI